MSSIPTLTRAVDKPTSKRPARDPRASVSPSLSAVNRGNSELLMPAPAGRHLLDIPVLTLAEHRSWTVSGLWQGQFDCALWLRTPQGVAHPLQLFVRYTDNQGEKNIFIDRCSAGSYRTVLLNGSMNFQAFGRVRDLGFYLVGASPGMNVLVEEWNFVPRHR